MASLERLRRDIENIASRPKAVTLAEITRIADQLGELGWSAKYRKGRDAWIFVIEGQVFTLSDHHPREQAHQGMLRGELPQGDVEPWTL